MKKLLVAGLGIFLSSAAFCGTFEEGKAASKKGDYPTALKIYRELADQGVAKAQNNLGCMYALGKGIPQDLKEAVTWYRKSAEQGLPEGQNNLGSCYSNGEGVSQDFTEAFFWLSLAASQTRDFAENRDIIAEQLPPATREVVHASCTKWLEDFEKSKAEGK